VDLLSRALPLGAWAALLLLPACTTRPQIPREGPAAVVARWVEIGPEGAVLARAITGSGACPELRVNGVPAPMQVRARPEAPAFPVLVCEATLGPQAVKATLDGHALPLPVVNPARIAVLGDTGCRLKGPRLQACNDPSAWPFARVAKSIAATQPDLVVHVGDYHYRESPCSADDPRCAGSPVGDVWDAWAADFFIPAAPLLAAAPWVMVRGNHEICHRAGEGWFRFLDPRPLPAKCRSYTEPYALGAGRVKVVVLDSASADDRHARPERVERYATALQNVAALASPRSWLFTHKPFWGALAKRAPPFVRAGANATLHAASRGALPKPIELVLAGHIHLFEALAFAERPPGIISGNGASALSEPISAPLAGLEVAGARLTDGSTFNDFGFVILEPLERGWSASVRNADGKPVMTCQGSGNTMRCRP
jgi:hypothetical protein